MCTYYLNTPLDEESVNKLCTGDVVYLSGKIFTARDMAHLKLKKIYDNKESFDEEFGGAVVFHAGPIVNIDKEKKSYFVSGIGPTSSIRMEPYSDMMGNLGVKALIGKGGMGELTTQAMKKHNMVYLLAAHGCSAIHTQRIKSVNKQYWMDEIGMPEALWVMECCELGPLIVGIDSKGRNLFEETRRRSKELIKSRSNTSAQLDT
ncbi:MAG: FumA C-terminus/TtdB family hydratase beta subunit [Bacillota bacterium]